MKIYIDLSNLMIVDFVTGIQRVVREVVLRMLENKKNEYILMTYSFRKNSFQQLDNEKFYNYFMNGTGEKSDIFFARKIEFRDIPSGAVFFDIDSVWNSYLKRGYLFPILKNNGVKIITQLYDIIPITHPQFCREITTTNFMLYLTANLKYADLIITSASATVDALNELTDRLSIERKKTKVVPLGCDFVQKKKSLAEIDENVKNITKDSKYILMVGTIEPRKNHSIVIDALESGLAEKGIKAVFAGRIGWNVEKLEKRIKEHPLYNKQLFFVEKPNDATVDYLYKNAYAVAFPTFNEGFGLPVIEAFQRGTPVIASDIKVIHEVAGDFAHYFDNTNKDDFVRCVNELLENPQEYSEMKEHLKDFVPFTWNECAEAMENAVTLANSKKVPDNISVKQMVCLTARNDDILATLPFIDKFMPFITEMVLCCPDRNVDELKEKYKGRIELKFLTDSEVLSGESLPDDHATRNFFLRCLALKNPVIDDVFIMTDDDYRPLRMISQADFIKENSYLAYYCYDLQEWKGTYKNPTSFDVSMKKTCKFLKDNNYPTMMYSSHQPQIIDKNIFNEMTGKYPEIKTQGLCDWSVYFNYGISKYPDMFRTVPYVSMGWPGAISDWDLYVQPKEFMFENHYDFLYQKGRVFEGLREDLHENTESENLQKVMRYITEIQKQTSGRDIYKSYSESYWIQYRELPSFAVICADSQTIAIHAPVYIQFKNRDWTRVPFTIDRDLIDIIGSEKILLMYWFSDDMGGNLSPVNKIQIDTENLDFMLTVFTTIFSERCVFNLRIIVEDKDITASASIQANII